MTQSGNFFAELMEGMKDFASYYNSRQVLFNADCHVLFVVTIPAKFNTHTRPQSVIFYTHPKFQDCVYIHHRHSGTDVYAPSYGTGAVYWGEEHHFLDHPEGLGGWLKDSDKDGLIGEDEIQAPHFYVGAMRTCPQCGSLFSNSTSNQLYQDFRALHRFRDELTIMQSVSILQWLKVNAEKHPFFAQRCEYCKKKHGRRLYGHLEEIISKYFPYSDRHHEEWHKGKAIRFLRAIGKHCRCIKDTTARQHAKKSIMRRIRRHNTKLSQSEVVFFQMIAGASAIKTMGGKYGTHNV